MTDPGPHPPSSYIIDTREPAEFARLIEQDRFVTQAMGDLFPRVFSEQMLGLDGEPIRVLDVACGPGSWALEIAFAYPEMEVTGIDLDPEMIAYARARARTQQRYNASFQVMDATKPFGFADCRFDFVNGRFLNGFLSRSTWPALVQQCVQVTKPGGWVRLTECNDLGMTTSPAMQELWSLLQTAWQTDPLGRLWPITPRLGPFFHAAGCHHIHEQPYLIPFSAPLGVDPEQEGRHRAVRDNLRVAMTLLQPYLVTHQVASIERVIDLTDQMTQELHANDFRGHWFFASVVGQKPASPAPVPNEETVQEAHRGEMHAC